MSSTNTRAPPPPHTHTHSDSDTPATHSTDRQRHNHNHNEQPHLPPLLTSKPLHKRPNVHLKWEDTRWDFSTAHFLYKDLSVHSDSMYKDVGGPPPGAGRLTTPLSITLYQWMWIRRT